MRTPAARHRAPEVGISAEIGVKIDHDERTRRGDLVDQAHAASPR